MTTIVCDLDGVVYLDGQAITGAGEALATLRDRGLRLLFVTNNATKSQQTVVESIARLTGLEVDESDVVTSGLVTAMALEGIAERVFIVGEAALVEMFRSRGFSVVSDRRDAQAVVCGMDTTLTYDKLADATLAIRGGARFYATNSDVTYPTPDGQKPGGGAIVAALEAASGVEAIVCGKPHEPTGRAVRRIAPEGDIVVVGDRLETDIAFGKVNGWFTALVLSGVTSAGYEVASQLEPDIVIDSLADLPAALGRLQT